MALSQMKAQTALSLGGGGGVSQWSVQPRSEDGLPLPVPSPTVSRSAHSQLQYPSLAP